MPKATWKGAVVAESDDTVEMEGNHYFPRDAVNEAHVRPSSQETMCPWKGTANYFDVVVGDEVNEGAAWYYADPKPAAASIRGRVAFWRGVTVQP